MHLHVWYSGWINCWNVDLWSIIWLFFTCVLRKTNWNHSKDRFGTKIQIMVNLNVEQLARWPIAPRSALSGRPLTDGSSHPGDTRRYFESSNEIVDDVMNNQWNSKSGAICRRFLMDWALFVNNNPICSGVIYVVSSFLLCQLGS